VPYEREGFRWEFDFSASSLELTTTTGERRRLSLRDGLSVAQFHGAVLEAMESVSMPVSISTMPSEIADAVPFPDDHDHATYDVNHATALHRALLDATRVFERFRSGFTGKASPVHFFWGSFDLAVTRFSGRLAPRHPGGLPNFPADVAAEAYSHQVTSVGFWPGDRTVAPLFYAYGYPTPDGFADAEIDVDGATWSEQLGEFVVPYAAIAAASDPDAALLAFCEQTHAAAADLAGWDRAHLECATPNGPDWWRERPHAEPAPVVDDDGVAVTDDADRHRYVITVDGAERGAAVYRRSGDRWLFVHTEIDPAFDGRGLGSRLARAALDDVASQGGRVVPLCPFIAGWIERHPEYDTLVDHDAVNAYRR
jgi:predicted GNAT family acetyltransferase